MSEAGLECLVARDLAEAWTHYDPARGHTPDVGNAEAVIDLERAGIPTVHLADELRRLGLWDDDAVTEPVRITPAGKPGRPFVFDEPVTVTLSTPWLKDAEIRYTLDGTVPDARSLRYERPLVLTKTATVRAAAFRQRRRVSLETGGFFVRLPAMPPRPDVYLDQVTPVPDQYAVVKRCDRRAQ
jgi:Chitobiase/beta-hexosaminidase C-terminal domain